MVYLLPLLLPKAIQWHRNHWLYRLPASRQEGCPGPGQDPGQGPDRGQDQDPDQGPGLGQDLGRPACRLPSRDTTTGYGRLPGLQ